MRADWAIPADLKTRAVTGSRMLSTVDGHRSGCLAMSVLFVEESASVRAAEGFLSSFLVTESMSVIRKIKAGQTPGDQNAFFAPSNRKTAGFIPFLFQ